MARKTFFLDQGEFVGGAERFLIDFLGQLQRSECRQIHPILVGTPCEDYLKLLHQKAPLIESIEFPIPRVRGNFLKKGFAVLNISHTAKKLKNLAKKHEIDQVFTNTPRTHFVMYLAKKLGIKCRWVVMLHDFTTPPQIMRRIAQKADVLIANSLPTRNWLHDAIEAKDQSKIRIVENGVDLDLVCESDITSEVQTVTILGRIDPRKGQQYAIEAADLLQERNPDLEFQIVGSSTHTDTRTTEYETKLQEFIKDRKLQKINFVGDVSDPFQAFSDSDLVLVLPTEPETFGRIVTEAMAVNRMVIAFDQTGPREIIQSYVQWLWRTHNIKAELEHFVVEANNSMSLAERIGHYADHPDELEILTAHMHEFIVENFSLKETKKRLLGIMTE